MLHDRFQSDQEQNDPRSDRQDRLGNVVLAHGSFANHRGKEKGQAASKLRVSLAGQLHKRTQNFERPGMRKKNVNISPGLIVLAAGRLS